MLLYKVDIISSACHRVYSIPCLWMIVPVIGCVFCIPVAAVARGGGKGRKEEGKGTVERGKEKGEGGRRGKGRERVKREGRRGQVRR